MTTITEGMTPSQFIAAMNANITELDYYQKPQITSLSANNSVDSNFNNINKEAYTSVLDTSAGKLGRNFILNINENFNLLDTASRIAMRDFSGLTRYVGNPILNYGTYPFGTVTGIGGPFLRYETKIGTTWYAMVQTDVLEYFVLATSTDLIEWTLGDKKIEKSVGSWDNSFLVTPSFFKIGNLWHCYYSAHNSSHVDQIGLATSSDFLTWTKYGTTPVFSSSQDNNRNVGIPNVIKIGDIYYLYYTSYKWTTYPAVDISDIKINYATSSDGINWTFGGTALSSEEGNWCNTFIDSYVIYNAAGYYEMVYSRSGAENNTQGFGYAISKDGINWVKFKTQVMGNGNSGEWDASQIGNPVLIEKDDLSALLYYTGQPSPNYAACGIANL